MGPVDLIISRNNCADAIRGEKSGAGIEASMPCPHPNTAVRPASRASPNFASHGIYERQIGLSDAGFPAISRSEIVEARKITRRKKRMDLVD